MKLIVACDPKGGIGYNNKLPWDNIQGDLPRFKQLTSGQVVAMGRNTWDSLPLKPLPKRTNYIVTNRLFLPPKGAVCINELKELYKLQNVWLIGGAKLIETCWYQIKEIHLTRTLAEYTCDTFIDLVKLEQEFMCYFKERHIDHDYEIWRRR